VWPYVNGKATFQGVDLESLDGPVMVDVVHYIFEDDHAYVSQESMEAQSSLRVNLYRTLYNKEYKYAVKSQSKQQGAYAQDFDFDYGPEDDGLVTPFSPKEKEPTKPYVPPTPFNPNSADPFGGVLSPPLK
jgi:hypothetical protein